MGAIRFAETPRPRASILILAWQQQALLLQCLRSLHATLDASVPFEVVVVSNDASQAVRDALRSQAAGIRLMESQVNLGFSGACNLGASVARGEYVILLNDDTVVAPEWLNWLVTTADSHPEAGAVGSMVLFPDGRIQEAGSIIWNDGSTMPIGRDLPGNSLTWQFVRQVDYASACSLLVRRRAWDEVGGFDAAFHPAYYEDVDLCLALRERGYSVLLEPRSRVWHHESASSNIDFKLFLFGRNQAYLHRKWRSTLALQEPAAPESEAACARAVWRARGAPTRVLAIDDRLPDPSLGSGYGRMFDALIEIAGAGHAVSIFPMLPGTSATSDALVSAGVAVVDEDLETHLSRPWVTYDVIIASRPHNFERVVAFVRRTQPGAILIYDCEALFWRRTDRQAKLATDPSERVMLERAAREMRAVEERIVIEADFAVTVSQEEADLLGQVDGCCPVKPLLPAESSARFSTRAFHERAGIAFVAGWMAGPTSPNADGLRWMVREVLPLVVAQLPWVTLYVTGANPPEALLDHAGPNVVFTGHVGDLTEFYESRKVAVAPLRFGSGVKVKTVQALQYGLPVVATPCGAEGIDQHGCEAIDISESPARFAQALVTLLTDRHTWETRRQAIDVMLARWKGDAGTGSWPEIVAAALARRVSGSYAVLEQS